MLSLLALSKRLQLDISTDAFSTVRCFLPEHKSHIMGMEHVVQQLSADVERLTAHVAESLRSGRDEDSESKCKLYHDDVYHQFHTMFDVVREVAGEKARRRTLAAARRLRQ